MVDAINAGDTNAFVHLFAPDGAFSPRGSFDESSEGLVGTQPISEGPLVEAWIAINDAWGFEADLRGCTRCPAPSRPDGGSSARSPPGGQAVPGDHRAVALRAPGPERWSSWEPECSTSTGPSGTLAALGYSGLEAWETWLDANHPEDAARWLEPAAERRHVEADEDLELAARPVPLVATQIGTGSIDGIASIRSGLVPYDPAFADEIDASINEYLQEQ